SLNVSKKFCKIEHCPNPQLRSRISESRTKPWLSIDFSQVSIFFIICILFAAVGTVVKTRNNVPKFVEKLAKKGGSGFYHNGKGTLCVCWMNSKKVLLMSNCHTSVTNVSRTMKDDTNATVI